MLRQPLFFIYWLPNHPVSWFASHFLKQPVRPPLATYSWLCSICVTYWTSCHTIVMPRHWTPDAFHPPFNASATDLRECSLLSGVFLPYTPSCCFQGVPGASSSPSKLAGLYAGHQKIALTGTWFWITAFHKGGMLVDSI